MSPFTWLRQQATDVTSGMDTFPLLMLTTLFFFDEFDTAAFNVLAPNIRNAFGLSFTEFGLLVVANLTIVLLAAVPMGHYGDRLPRRKFVVAGAILAGICSFFTGLVSVIGLLIIVRLGNGIGRLVNDPIHSSLLADYYKPDDRPRVFGFHRNAVYIGTIVGSALAGVMTWLFGTYKAAFLVLIVPIVAAALYAASELPDDQLLEAARRMPAAERAAVLRACAGARGNRRHRPGRAFERTAYRFDVLTDYGAFRDLQRHRLLTLEWQPLSTRHGYTEPDALREAGVLDGWTRVMDASADLYEGMRAAGLDAAAPYAVAMAYRVRFYMEMNAREAMHVIELRTAPQGHPAYRRVCQQMHRLIAEKAGHTALAEAMRFADHSSVELERLASERSLERKRSRG